MNQNQLNQAVLAAALNQAGLGMVGSLLMGGGAGDERASSASGHAGPGFNACHPGQREWGGPRTARRCHRIPPPTKRSSKQLLQWGGGRGTPPRDPGTGRGDSSMAPLISKPLAGK